MKKTANFFKFLILFAIILLPLTKADAGTFDPKLKYKTLKTEHFAIHYPEKLEEIAKKVGKISENVHDTLTKKYKWDPWGRTQMMLVDPSDEVNDVASVLPYNWIYIRVTAPNANMSISNYDEWLRMLIMHEYTHIVHLDQAKGFWLPARYLLGKLMSPNGMSTGWIKEGLAVHEETVEGKAGRGRASYTEMLLRTDILDGDFLNIDEADGLQWKWPSGAARYLYGAEFLEYLANTRGEESLYQFVEYTSKSPLVLQLNRQARRAFNNGDNLKFQTKKIHNRYVKEKKEGVPRSKTFYGLWREWEDFLKEKYAKQKEKIEKDGITPFETFATSKYMINTVSISPDGSKVAYTETTPFGPSKLFLMNIDGSGKKMLKKSVSSNQLSFSRDGKYLYYAKGGKYKRYGFYYDLYQLDLETNKSKKLTTAKRVDEPDVSPDGSELVCVGQDEGTRHLEIFNIEDKKLKRIPVKVPEFTQFSNPRFSPDGKMIAVSVAKPGNIWDLYIYSREGKEVKQVTDDFAIDRDPEWSPDGKWIYFVSDRTGISNIYRYNVKSGKEEKVTNVLTGVFYPELTPDGYNLFVQYYNGHGYDLRKVSLGGQKFVDAKNVDTSWLKETYGRMESDEREIGEASRLPMVETPTAGELFDSKITKYKPLGQSLLLPRFVVPGFALLDDAFLVSAMTGAADPLRWHNWTAGVTYRTDSKHTGYFARYWYNRFTPIVDVGIMDYSVDFGVFRYSTIARSFHLYEKRRRLFAGFAMPYKRHAFSLRYFYEDRNPTNVALTPAEVNYFNFGAFAGFKFNYGYNDSKMYAASISQSGGRKLKIGTTVTDKALGSANKNEQIIFAGDFREYVSLGKRNVLAFRISGGMTWGDELRQGTFSMGGDLGEGVMAAGGSLYYFPLRGLPMATLSRTRAMLMSAEYRMPLFNIQRGLGTAPLFVNDVHLAFFADYGNAWNANQDTGKYFFDDFFLGTGLEVRADFVVGYGLPIRGRLGYGIIVVNRDRLGSLNDPIMGQSIKNGILILQFGTSF